LDTSALVKLYVDEDGSDIVRRYVEQTPVISTAKIAFVEARSAFARAKREDVLNSTGYRQIVDRLHYDWKRYMIVEISDALIEAAGELVEEFSLRGFDSIHLASALFLQQQTGHTVLAACWDVRLWDALKKSGLETVPEKRPGNDRGD
jgi:predicted nucleic acid-binding protein